MPKGSTRARIPGRAGLSAELQTKLEALDKLTDALTFGLLHEYEAVKRMFLQERPNESFDDLLKPETVHIVIDQRKGYARVQRWRKRLRDSDWKLKADSFLLHFDQHAHDSWRFLKGLVEFSQITTFDTALPFLQEAHSFRVGRKHPDQRVWAPRDITQALDMFKSQVDMRHSTVDIAPGTDSEPMSAASSDDEHEQGRFTEADEVGAQISDGLDEYSLVSPHHIATAKSEAVRHSPDSPVPVRESLPPLTSGDASTGGRLVRLRDSSPHVNLSYQPAAQDASENAMDGTISVLDQDPDRTDVEAVTGPPHAIATEKSKVAHHSPDSPVPVKESSQLPALTSGDASTGGRLTHILDSSSHMNPSHQPAAQDAFENAMDGTITVLVQDPDRTDMEAVPDPKAKQRVEQLQSSAQPRRSDLTGALGSLQGSSWLSSTAIELVLAFFTRDRDYRVLDPSFLPVASPLSLADKPPISLRQQKWVLVPMHHDSHWTVGFLDLGTGVIEYYDSLSRELAQARRALLCLGNYFSLDSPRLKDIVWRVEAKVTPLLRTSVAPLSFTHLWPGFPPTAEQFRLWRACSRDLLVQMWRHSHASILRLLRLAVNLLHDLGGDTAAAVAADGWEQPLRRVVLACARAGLVIATKEQSSEEAGLVR